MHQKLYQKLGNAIRDRRQLMGLSQAELGEQVEMARTSITSVEVGKQQLLVHQLLAISSALRIEPKELIQSVKGLPKSEPKLTNDPQLNLLVKKLTETVTEV